METEQQLEQYLIIIMQAVAASSTADQYFMTITEKLENPSINVNSAEAYAAMLSMSAQIEAIDDKAAILMQMLNYGSFSEMQAEYKALSSVTQSKNVRKPPKCVIACLDIVNKIIQDLRIPRMRARMNLYFRAGNGRRYNECFDEIQQMIMSHISEEYQPVTHQLGNVQNILNKILPTASETFLINNPEMVDTLSEAEMATIDLVQLQLGRHLTEMNKQTTDPIQIDDVMDMFTMVLENKVAATEENVAKISDAIRFTPPQRAYAMAMSAFSVIINGEIPGSISPSKIAALLGTSHQERLMGSVVQLTLSQMQKYDQAGNGVTSMHSAAMNMQKLAKKKFLNKGGVAVVEESKFLVPVGPKGYNDLHRQIKDWTSNPVNSLAGLIERQNPDSKDMFLYPIEERLLTVLLMMILAAVRVRLDATGQTDFETFTGEDSFWLLLVKKLSGQLHNPVVADEIANIAERTIFLGVMSNKDRLTQLKVKDPQLEIVQKTVAKAELLVSEVANTLEIIIKDNIFSSGGLYQVLLLCLYKALASKNRINRDIEKRKVRRLVQMQVSQE